LKEINEHFPSFFLCLVRSKLSNQNFCACDGGNKEKEKEFLEAINLFIIKLNQISPLFKDQSPKNVIYF